MSSAPPTTNQIQAMRERERRWDELRADKRMRDDVWLEKMIREAQGGKVAGGGNATTGRGSGLRVYSPSARPPRGDNITGGAGGPESALERKKEAATGDGLPSPPTKP